MMEPYEHKDSDGGCLRIFTASSPGEPPPLAAGVVANATIRAEDLPKITGKFYEACGLPSPVILDRPDVTGPGVQWQGDVYTGRLGSMVTIGRRVEQPDELDPDAALAFAAAIAANAEAIKRNDPDPAEVDDLAMVLTETLGSGAMGIAGARPWARRLLASGRVRMVNDDA